MSKGEKIALWTVAIIVGIPFAIAIVGGIGRAIDPIKPDNRSPR